MATPFTTALRKQRRTQAGLPPVLAPVYTTRMLSSIAELDFNDAVALFGDGVDGASYLKACEDNETPQFRTSLIAVYRGPTVVAAAPVFRIEHRLDMALGERVRALGDLVYKHAPKLVALPVLCLGTRASEECPIGLRPGLTRAERDKAFEVLLAGLAHHANKAGIRMLSVVAFSDQDARWGDGLLQSSGFMRMGSPPVATLHLPFKDEAEYIASLSTNMRKDWKRKLKTFKGVDVEIRHDIAGLEAEIEELMDATRARRKADFGDFSDIPKGYIAAMVEALGAKSVIVVTRVGGVMASCSVSMVDGDRLLGKFIGMRYPLALEHDIYFLNWLTCVRYCIERRISWLQVGITSYRQKVRLGCKLKRSWVYFKHTGKLLGPLFRALGPRFSSFDAIDPDLVQLGADAPYLAPDVPTGRPLLEA